MYNLHSHYENVFNLLNTIVTDPRVLYLYPFGATKPENIESLMGPPIVRTETMSDHRGPLFIMYDQEPILDIFNDELFTHIQNSYIGPFILVTTEKNSETVERVKEKFGWPVVYYFHHIFAAHDWYRGYRYDSMLIDVPKRLLKKKYITFNRLHSAGRIYRPLLINELIKNQILDQGYVSFNDVCPENNLGYSENLLNSKFPIPEDLIRETITNIDATPKPLRVDYKDQVTIPNHSMVLSAVRETQESFLYVVTETCYWEHKCHLTEKIFKPIVSRMPFLLVGPAHNLAYLKSYGFKTFDQWVDESYDAIEDPVARMHAIGNTLKDLCQNSVEQLQSMLLEMQPVLEYNYNLFYSQGFLDYAWGELTQNLIPAVLAAEDNYTHQLDSGYCFEYLKR